MGGKAALVGERGNGMVGPVDVGAAVDEVHRVKIFHGQILPAAYLFGNTGPRLVGQQRGAPGRYSLMNGL